MKGINRIRSVVFKHATPILIGCLAIFVLIKMPVFFSVANLLSLGSQAAVWGVVAIGMTMLIMTGVTDISVGAQVYLGGIIVVRIYQMTENMLLGALCAVVICMLVSSVNGFVIAKLGLPSMIATLAMQQVCNGAASIMIGKDMDLLKKHEERREREMRLEEANENEIM